MPECPPRVHRNCVKEAHPGVYRRPETKCIAGFTFIEHSNVNIKYEKMDIDEVDNAHVLWLTGAWRF
jgi:hypothetical protein